jgi:hypothetical protein
MYTNQAEWYMSLLQKITRKIPFFSLSSPTYWLHKLQVITKIKISLFLSEVPTSTVSPSPPAKVISHHLKHGNTFNMTLHPLHIAFTKYTKCTWNYKQYPSMHVQCISKLLELQDIKLWTFSKLLRDSWLAELDKKNMSLLQAPNCTAN